MVYNIQNRWISIRCPSSENLNTTKHDVSGTEYVFCSEYNLEGSEDGV
jgi:hypothetical protein